MAETDALAGFSFNTGGGLFLKEFPAKIRVMTTDPMVSTDSYGNTRFSFAVYNHTEGKAQILSKGSSIAQAIQQIHEDEDWGANIRNVDIKITTTGTGKETRYSVNALPNSKELTNEQIQEVANISLDTAIKGGVRLSEFKNGKKPQAQERTDDEVNIEDVDKPINLDDIPF